jgi:hypothetical protein
MNVRDKSGDGGVCERVILKWILKKWCGRAWTGFFCGGLGPEKMIGFCEHGNEPMGTVNCGEFLD